MKLLLVATILIFSSSCTYIMGNNQKFDSEKWKNGNARDRGRMVYDLRDSKILIGKTEQEVNELLGKKTDIETKILTDEYFGIHYDEKTHKVISTDIGD